MAETAKNRHFEGGISKPEWLRKRLPRGADFENVRRMLRGSHLHTVCQEARCPNIWECFSRRTATFLILGDRCTRNCRFCAIECGPLAPPDPGEPERVARAAQSLGLDYVVVTSVTRDDLPDGGASLLAETIRAIRERMPHARVEVLIPDFKGDPAALETVLAARPHVLNHNVETVPRLYPRARPQADYHRSLALLARAAKWEPRIPTKSGIMLGLGETRPEIEATIRDIYEAGCRFLTLGQYLQPTTNHLPVAYYVPPEEFEGWRAWALDLGFEGVFSGPYVRSSYRAREMVGKTNGNNNTRQEVPDA